MFMQKYCANHAKIIKNRKSKADKRAATKSGKNSNSTRLICLNINNRSSALVHGSRESASIW